MDLSPYWGLESLPAWCTFVLEADRIRVLDYGKAEELWRGWWARKKQRK